MRPGFRAKESFAPACYAVRSVLDSNSNYDRDVGQDCKYNKVAILDGLLVEIRNRTPTIKKLNTLALRI